jgi:hypothetical protein
MDIDLQLLPAQPERPEAQPLHEVSLANILRNISYTHHRMPLRVVCATTVPDLCCNICKPSSRQSTFGHKSTIAGLF